ncbi:hypothetical protein AURDEDRAFT_175170 [Auricularia subglabra TFB-10046 SS5]|nr:hypothetical protein AURDEDRAFT_175170 [Auricularia subglabra TFB-10046 SS5]
MSSLTCATRAPRRSGRGDTQRASSSSAARVPRKPVPIVPLLLPVRAGNADAEGFVQAAAANVPRKLPSNVSIHVHREFTALISFGMKSSKTQNGTVHAASSNKTFSVDISFEGSAIYVFFVLYSGLPTNLSVTFDDKFSADTFSHVPSTTFEGGYHMYNKLVFKNANLAHGEHRLTVADWNTGISERRAPLYSLFDYALYTTDVDDLSDSDTQVSIATTAAPPDSTIPIPKSGLKLRHRLAIICTSAAAAFTIITGTVLCLCQQRKQRRAHRSSALAPIVYANDPDDHLQPYPISLSRPVKAILRLLDEKPRRPEAKLQFDKIPPPAPVHGAVVALEATPEQSLAHDDVADLRAELKRMCEENEMLRQTSGPPPEYSDGERCESA